MTNNGENRIENTDYYYSENCNNNVISKPPNNKFDSIAGRQKAVVDNSIRFRFKQS